MSKASGLLLIVVGVGVAAYVMPSSEPDSSTGEPDQQQHAQASVIAKDAPTGVVSTGARPEQIVAPIPKPAVKPATNATRTEAKATASGPTKPIVVTVSPRVNETTVTGHVRQTGQQKGAAILPGDRVGLTRELQRELKRVGCYDGEINGTWSPVARRAMKAFTDRVNATLPVDQPDYILLTLVQGSQERVCGTPCPAGQGMSEDGRCLPSAVIAHAARKAPAPALPATATKGQTVERPVAATSGWSTTTTVVAPNLPEVPEGRMALAGPKKEVLPVRPIPLEGGSRLASIAETPDPTAAGRRAERVPPRGVYERRPKPAAVEKPGRRYAAAPRKKFGVWFFRQQDASNH